MERNVNIDLYLTLSEDSLSETKEEAKAAALSNYGEDETECNLLYDDCNWKVDELYFDKDSETIEVHGEFFSNGKKLGYLSPSIHVGSELLIEIIEHYMKKLGRLKTIMESLK